MKIPYLLLATALTVSACVKAPRQGDEVSVVSDGENATAQTSDQQPTAPSAPKETWQGFTKIEPADISDDLFMINSKWMLITGGREAKFNSMTASWGGFGTIWNRPIAFMAVRSTRYTYDFLRKDTIYTLSFFDESHRSQLELMGRKSGRDTDKVKETGLTPVSMPMGGMSYTEAETVIECKKLLDQALEPRYMTNREIASDYYRNEGKHHLFFGEIVNVWRKSKQ